MPQAGLFSGGWRYVTARNKQQIWSNFPSTEVEYDVILEEETIAVIPLSIVKQLEIGKLVQLAGRVLKVLQIQETMNLREVFVEEAESPADQELFWVGFGIPTSFEVAQKMGELLFSQTIPQGLFRRTEQLLKKARKRFERSITTLSKVHVHRLKTGFYRYETFLGSIGNFILYQVVKEKYDLCSEGFSIQFDELGIECSIKISFAFLDLPTSIPLLHSWVAERLPFLVATFSWNNWLHALPQEQQIKEITAHLADPRVLEQFACYLKDDVEIPDLPLGSDVDPLDAPKWLAFEGEPWSIENERQTWEKLAFPEIPLEKENIQGSAQGDAQEVPQSAQESTLTASRLQEYVEHEVCPRWARLQALRYSAPSHPRFREKIQEKQQRREEGAAFKKQVIEQLQKREHLVWGTPEWSWKEAIGQVLSQKNSLFLVRATLVLDGFKGSPDFIYIKHEGSHICIEIWDIKNTLSCNYAHKWRVAFYAFLLKTLLKAELETFSLPIQFSKLGGVIHRHVDSSKPFERTAFFLFPYQSWLPRLIAKWKTDATQRSVQPALASHCTSCTYFSYCYQEMLFKDPLPEMPASTSLGVDSNDFPKNTKQWFFLAYDSKRIQWQCWEEQKVISETTLLLSEHATWSHFQQAIVSCLQKEWSDAVEAGKNPHFLVYAPVEWHRFQAAFQSTPLRALWAMHVCHTSMQTVLQTHFTWKVLGELTAAQVGRCLKVPLDLPSPLSLYHRQSPFDLSWDLYRHIWDWILVHVKSTRVVRFEKQASASLVTSLISAYHATHIREKECKTHAILAFQKNPLEKRVEQFRAIGPCTFLETVRHGKQKSYLFSIGHTASMAKFRAGDFLKLSPVESNVIQEGFSVVLETYSPEKNRLTLRPVEQKLLLSKNMRYALDENATDWNAPKIEKVLNRLKDHKFRPELLHMLLGKGKSFPASCVHWAEQWYQRHADQIGLNVLQRQALLLPFQKSIGLVEGPPGTGKTHLLVWTLVALIAHAHALRRVIKILVTAQTHHAIDQILIKVAQHLLPIQYPYGNAAGMMQNAFLS